MYKYRVSASQFVEGHIEILIFKTCPRGLRRVWMNFILVSGLFCDPSIMKPLEARLKKAYPESEVRTVSSLGFRTVWAGQRVIGRVIDCLSGHCEREIILIGHSAGGQVIIPSIDDPRVKAVIAINPPSYNPLDLPLRVWPVQFIYTIQTVCNRLFCISEKHRAKLFGGILPEAMKGLSYGWLALQMSMGALLGNFSPKTKARNKFLAFWSTGDPTVLSKAVVKMAVKHHGLAERLVCAHHYPLIEEEGLDQIMTGIEDFLLCIEKWLILKPLCG